MPRVVLIGDFPPPAGGISTHVAQLYARFRREGGDVRVVDIGKGREDGHADDCVEGASSAAELVQRLDAFAQQGYLFHLHTSGNNPKSWMVSGLVGAIARFRGVPAMVTLHSGIVHDYLSNRVDGRALARISLTLFNRVIAVSEPVKEAVVASGVDERRVLVHPAFLPSEVRPGRVPAPVEVLREDGIPFLCYAHHPAPVYGRALLMRAFKKLLERHPTLKLAIFGPGTLEPAFLEDMERSGLGVSVLNLGELDHPSALAVMQASNVFVRPTLNDGDSISVREALALGIPCVASTAAPRPPGTTLFQSGEETSLVSALDLALTEGHREIPIQPDAGAFLDALYRQLQQSKSTPGPAAAASV